MTRIVGDVRRRLAGHVRAVRHIMRVAPGVIARGMRILVSLRIAVPLLWLVLIELGLAAANHAGWQLPGAEAAADRFMRWHVGRVIDPAAARGFAFIDVDQRSFLSWCQPDPLPRSKLVQLIQYAASSG